MEQGRCTAIVLAAGQGKRMHSKIQKQFLEIGGKPVLNYSLHCFQESPLIRDIILVTGEEMISYCEQEIVKKYGFSKVRKVTAGGKERYDSVYAGLLCCQDTDYVYIHDGARPFITEEMVQRGYEAVKRNNACVMGMPSKDTVKLADSSGYRIKRCKRKCGYCKVDQSEHKGVRQTDHRKEVCNRTCENLWLGGKSLCSSLSFSK